ncbi:hypothetical protein [Leucobacter denitrificans]|uniref:Uncharacterized protein n=1 Tax=Leucobacter denitrificans TaxID=683042 RepID=A0A7G9S547_9MICO|nr:hypothetical protein [Leucobacter denitrificans]QNN62972.1 hypothetical protein H9L06_00860 [Leucobacter denitrificans]
MAIKVGSQLRSTASSVQVVVVRGSEADGTLEAAGAELTHDATANSAPNASAGETIQVGKRYVDADSGIELLVIAAGPGPIAFNGRNLTLKDSKPLPASD